MCSFEIERRCWAEKSEADIAKLFVMSSHARDDAVCPSQYQVAHRYWSARESEVPSAAQQVRLVRIGKVPPSAASSGSLQPATMTAPDHPAARGRPNLAGNTTHLIPGCNWDQQSRSHQQYEHAVPALSTETTRTPSIPRALSQQRSVMDNRTGGQQQSQKQHTPRKLVLCFDGTGNKFRGDESDSNILKIFRMLDRTASDQCMSLPLFTLS